MLVGRSQELDRLGSLLDAARLGRAGALAICGDAGIGKTALLTAAAAQAGDFKTLRGRGIESEGTLSFAVLVELLGGSTDLLETLRPSLRRALETACRLRPGSVDPATVGAAWAALLTAAAERNPVLVLVDDLQWADADSAAALLFAARRLHHARVVTLFSVRFPGPRAIGADGVEQLHLAPLDDTDARVLAPGAPRSTIDAAAGNPLALVELARDGGAPNGAATVAELLFGTRIDALSDAGLRALLAVALDTSGSADLAAAAAGGRQAVEELQTSSLATVQGGEIELRHPLLRTLILARAWADERRDVHGALARALPDGFDRTRHRALAATSPDAGLADELESLAARAAGRAGVAWALERSAELTPPGEQRALRLLAAARSAFDVRDMTTARRLMLRARDDDHAITRTGLDELAARLALADGAHIEGARALRAVAIVVADEEPQRAVRLLVTAAYVLATNAQAAEALGIVEEARSIGARSPVLDLLIASAHADAVGAAGEFVVAQRLFRELAAAADREPEVHADREARLVLVEALYAGCLYDRARQVVVAAERDARVDGAIGELQLALALRFSIELSAGRLDVAAAAAVEELELAVGLGRATERREALGHVAWGDAFAGRAEECRAHVDERLRLSESAGLSTATHPALGLLELGLENYHDAVLALRASEAGVTRHGNSPAAGFRPCAVDLVEALLRAGLRAEAETVLAQFEREASRLDRPLALALAARGRALLASDDAFECEFERSLELDRGEPSPFESARTQLCFGERLRRARRRADARVHLREACEGFATCGAALWLARAQAELAATGERARKRGAGSGGDLTPQEGRVATLVSGGLSNREIAERLFVSTNTVETHLRHVFQKLGVRSRTELATRFTDFRDSIDPVES